MRGADNTVNTVRGESALSCNTFGRPPLAGFPRLFHRRKRKSRVAFWTLETDSGDRPARLICGHGDTGRAWQADIRRYGKQVDTIFATESARWRQSGSRGSIATRVVA